MRAALRYGAIVLAVVLFLLSLRRSDERAGRLAERLETTEKSALRPQRDIADRFRARRSARAHLSTRWITVRRLNP